MKPIPRNELKVGMIVRGCLNHIFLNGEKIEAVGRDDNKNVVYCMFKDGSICDCSNLDNLYLVEEPRGEIAWENLKAGDYLQHSDGSRVKVLAVLGDCFLSSETRNHDSAASWVTKKQIDKESWSIIQPTKSIREVTQQEVNEKFGEEVRIKK